MKVSALVLSALSLQGLVSATTEFYDYKTTECTGEFVDRLVGDGYAAVNTCLGITQNKMSVKLIKADPRCSRKLLFCTLCRSGDEEADGDDSVSIHGSGLHHRHHGSACRSLQAWELAKCEGGVPTTAMPAWRLLLSDSWEAESHLPLISVV